MPVTSKSKVRLGVFMAALMVVSGSAQAAIDIAQTPLFINAAVPPLNMLVMGRDHTLYYEAYNDASDLDGDGFLDTRFKPDDIDYYGYFDSAKCYQYVEGDTRFEPVGATSNSRFDGSCGGNWSGNFLNYVTMSRIDALRKVLYGGKRVVDTRTSTGAGVTVLERSAIPQDGHSWGKEYTSVAVDGYDISNYTPLAVPQVGTRHLFANVTIGASPATSVNAPLLRVLRNSRFRIWEWVSIEAPVAGDRCEHGSSGPTCVYVAGVDTSHPSSSLEFADLIKRMEGNVLIDGVARTRINKTANGAGALADSGTTAGQADNYVSVLKGIIKIPTAGTYQFAVDGDDAVEVLIDGQLVVGWYGGHGAATLGEHSGSITLTAGNHDLEFRHEEVGGGDSYRLAWWNGTTWEVVPASSFENLKLWAYGRTVPASTRDDPDYVVRVQVCAAGPLEDNCQSYTRVDDGISYVTHKPVGLLQEFGTATDETSVARMKFGLLTGSYRNNLRGGVLRRAVGDISDELDPETGVFDDDVVGVIETIDRLGFMGYNGSQHGSRGNSGGCGLITNRAIDNNECNMWGNPVAEMMYETLRYFAGATSATSDYSSNVSTNGYETGLGLPLVATWENPYVGQGAYSCAAPVQTIISDINPSYDTDDLPGTAFGDGVTASPSRLSSLNVANEGQTIWNGEFGSGFSRQHFIGQSAAVSDGAPTAKTVTSFGNIRGLAPAEPTKMGGYYSASLAYYGLRNDLSAATGDQKLSSYVVALASPLPQFRIPVGDHFITLVPFGKSVGSGSTPYSAYHPTNTIVDFYVEDIAEDGRSGTFRINFEDVEQGNDHDMDAIVRYEYEVIGDNQLRLELTSEYAAGSVVQHMGYVISGTTADGVYLEVRDEDTSAANDVSVAYTLDTPPSRATPSDPRGADELPLQATRTFTVNTSSGASTASLLKGPLWYAAKWGGFKDRNGNGIPDLREEWTSAAADESDPDPDNYYLVTNALGLRDQLTSAFNNILIQTSSASAVATNSTRLDTGTQIFQARFNSEFWSGELRALNVNANGSIGSTAWEASELIPAENDRTIATWDHAAEEAVEFEWGELSETYQAAVGSEALINYLRGDTAGEERNGGSFRDRPSGLLGDIVNSDPVFVGNQDYGFSRLPIGEPERPTADSNPYRTFKSGISRKAMVYAGANDGMLHGFCAGNCGSASPGQEILAYIPGALANGLSQLADPAYQHRYYVDGSARVVDAYLGTGSGAGWATVLLGSLGAGGRSVFALDVTDPDNFGPNKVLWEFPNADTPEADRLEVGQGITQPTIARLAANDKWVAIFGNGYNSQSGQAALFIVDLNSGELLKRIPVGTAGDSGLSAVFPADLNADGITDYVYAGDMKGNVWRFDLNGSTQTSWAAGLSGKPIFTTQANQPITTRLVAGNHPSGGVMLYFGTGRYLGDTDRIVGDEPPVQSFYGVWDRDVHTSVNMNNKTQLVALSDLQQQTIVYESSSATTRSGSAADFAVRVMSDSKFEYGTNGSRKQGWYLNLVYPSGTTGDGERVTSSATLRGGKIIFATSVPSGDACAYGGNSWLMEVDAMSGGRLEGSVFDVNNDGVINDDDFAEWGDDGENQGSVGGKGFEELIRNPGIISGGEVEYKYTSGSSGNIGVTLEDAGTAATGRQSWRQLQ